MASWGCAKRGDGVPRGGVGPRVNEPPPSLPPLSSRSVTWPIVAYALVRELPYTMMVVSGCIIAAIMVFRVPTSTLEPLAAIIIPAVVTALARSRPAETLDLGGRP